MQFPMKSLVLGVLALAGCVLPLAFAGADSEKAKYKRAEDRWICGKSGTQLEINQCAFDSFQKLDEELNLLYRAQIKRIQGTPHEVRLRSCVFQ